MQSIRSTALKAPKSDICSELRPRGLIMDGLRSRVFALRMPCFKGLEDSGRPGDGDDTSLRNIKDKEV